MTTQQLLNGVSTADLAETMRAIRKDPTLARCVFRARNRWVDGGLNRASVKDFRGAGGEQRREKPFVFDLDEPPALLGQDRGANPVEYLLAALSGCVTTSLVYHAAARGIELHEVESRYEGDLDLHGFLGLDPDVRNGYERIRITFKVKGDASEEELDELVRIAQERSPVFDMVTNSVPVTVTREK